MAKTPTRLAGPALVSSAAATKYTGVSSGAVIRHLHISNPTASAVDFTLSIGTDAAGTRLFDGLSIPADSVYERHVYWVIAAAEIIQAFAGTTNVITLTLTGDVIT